MTAKTVFAGFGGQGVLMMGYIFAFSAMRDGKHVTYLPSYGAEVRGGTANCTVVVSDEEIASPVASSPDFAIVMNKPSMTKYQAMIRRGGLMIINSSLIDSDPTRDDIEVIKVPANDMASELGSDRTLNMIMLGAFAAKTKTTTLDSLMNGVTEILKGKRASLMELNRKGLDRGAEYVLKGA
jgi:2-oxoglutarate ferredoxin oxidoreductase subunit gamma